MAELPANAVSVSADAVVLDDDGIYMGFSFRETSGSVEATVLVYDNASEASGTLLDAIELSPGQSAREWYGPQGINVANGIYVDVTGDVDGSLRTGAS